jgi:hypothetical protein
MIGNYLYALPGQNRGFFGIGEKQARAIIIAYYEIAPR